MTSFRSFTFPLWELFAGNLLLLACCLLYLAWWIVSYRPNAPGGSAGTLYITAAFIFGIVAIVLMGNGISSLSADSRGIPVKLVIAGVATLFVVMLCVTTLAFHRMVTSELLILHVWAVLELCAVAVLYNTGRYGAGRAAVLAALVGIATIAGFICYVLYYRLDETASYRVGMVPLATDAFVMAILLAVLAAS